MKNEPSISQSMKIPPHIPPFFYMPTPETLLFINTDKHSNTNKNMTFELLKVAGNVREEYCNGQTCKMGFPVIINQNYCI